MIHILQPDFLKVFRMVITFQLCKLLISTVVSAIVSLCPEIAHLTCYKDYTDGKRVV